MRVLFNIVWWAWLLSGLWLTPLVAPTYEVYFNNIQEADAWANTDGEGENEKNLYSCDGSEPQPCTYKGYDLDFNAIAPFWVLVITVGSILLFITIAKAVLVFIWMVIKPQDEPEMGYVYFIIFW